MSGCLNKVILIGNVGREPVVATSVNGKPYAKFSVATEERFTDEFGNQQQTTQWHNIMIWGAGAELVAQSVHKGTRVMVEGRLETSSYQDRNTGQMRSYTKVAAREIIPLNEIAADTGPVYGPASGPDAMNPEYQSGNGNGGGYPSEYQDRAGIQEYAGGGNSEYDDDRRREGPDQAMQALREIYDETGDGSLLTEIERGCL